MLSVVVALALLTAHVEPAAAAAPSGEGVAPVQGRRVQAKRVQGKKGGGGGKKGGGKGGDKKGGGGKKGGGSGKKGPGKKSGSSAKKPSPPTKKPSSAPKKPSSAPKKPSSAPKKPSSSAKKPSSAPKKPPPPATRPSSSTKKPSSSAKKPSSSAKKPSSSTRTPGSGPARPSPPRASPARPGAPGSQATPRTTAAGAGGAASTTGSRGRETASSSSGDIRGSETSNRAGGTGASQPTGRQGSSRSPLAPGRPAAPSSGTLRASAPALDRWERPRAEAKRSEGPHRLSALDARPRPTRSVRQGAVPAVHQRPAHLRNNPRFARPQPDHLVPHPLAAAPPPRRQANRAHYVRWWVHPWYRWQHTTWVVVVWPWVAQPWRVSWRPPPRRGWVWVTGVTVHDHWCPGYWMPESTPAHVDTTRYTWVPGFWLDTVWVEGFWRATEREGFAWVDGEYAPDGSYLVGHWLPEEPWPSGMTWEAGFWDGTTWVSGFWRPQHRAGFAWVPARFGKDGIRENGFWEPEEDRPDSVWVPGWFDGTGWVSGFWESLEHPSVAPPESWEPEEGVVPVEELWVGEEGMDSGGAEDDLPLALPVE